MKDLTVYLKPVEAFPSLLLTDSTPSALAKTHGSHDGVLVFDNKKKFMGMWYAYHAFFKKRPLAQTKITNHILKPPHLTIHTPLAAVVEHMLSLRLYTLPVFSNNGKIFGVLTAKEIIDGVIKTKMYPKNFFATVSIEEPLTVYEQAKIKDIYSSMKDERQTRAVVVNKSGQVVGIIGRRDMYMALVQPSPRERLKKQGGKKPSVFFDREWITKLEYPVKAFQTTPIFTALATDTMNSNVAQLLQSKYNSIVLVNNKNHPLGVISIRALLKAFLDSLPEKHIPLTITDKKQVVSAFRKQEIEEIVTKYVKKLQKRTQFKRIELVVDSIKHAKKHIMLYEVSAYIFFSDSKPLVAKSKQYTLRTAVQEVMDKTFKQAFS